MWRAERKISLLTHEILTEEAVGMQMSKHLCWDFFLASALRNRAESIDNERLHGQIKLCDNDWVCILHRWGHVEISTSSALTGLCAPRRIIMSAPRQSHSWGEMGRLDTRSRKRCCCMAGTREWNSFRQNPYSLYSRAHTHTQEVSDNEADESLNTGECVLYFTARIWDGERKTLAHNRLPLEATHTN